MPSENTLQAILLPVNEDTPRMISVEFEWVQDEDDAVPWHKLRYTHLFSKGAFVRRQQIQTMGADGPALDDAKCLSLFYNDNFLQDGSRPNRCVSKVTNGKAPHPWSDPIIVLRQRPQAYSDSVFMSANLAEDLEPLRRHLLEYDPVSAWSSSFAWF
ncbi:hypothetical protein EV715DRAFT_190478 [Schizophyllum commune]